VMRYVHILLCLYVLGLSLYPCADKLYFDGHLELAESEDDPAHTHDEADHCSPFCTCGCCSAPMSQPKPFDFHFSRPTAIRLYTNLADDLFERVPAIIWQPPRSF
jgi:hypothetical protein